MAVSDSAIADDSQRSLVSQVFIPHEDSQKSNDSQQLYDDSQRIERSQLTPQRDTSEQTGEQLISTPEISISDSEAVRAREAEKALKANALDARLYMDKDDSFLSLPEASKMPKTRLYDAAFSSDSGSDRGNFLKFFTIISSNIINFYSRLNKFKSFATYTTKYCYRYK